MIAPHHGRELRGMGRLETAFDGLLSNDLPTPHGIRESLDWEFAKVGVLEHLPCEPHRSVGHDHRIGLGQSLESGRKIGRLAHHDLLPEPCVADAFADDHGSGGNTNADLQFAPRRRCQPSDSLDDPQACV